MDLRNNPQSLEFIKLTAATISCPIRRHTMRRARRSAACCGIGVCSWPQVKRSYIDTLELTLYNSVLGGVSLEGTEYFYVNPLRNETPLPTELRWSRTRVPFMTSYCCPPNVVRTVAQANGYVFAKQDEAILINLYGASSLATNLLGQPLQLTQHTNHPWDGAVSITFDQCPSDAFSLKLRIPGWTQGVKIIVNDIEVNDKAGPSGFVGIQRRWRSGDKIAIEFAMPVELIEAHPLVEETRNQVAIKRGPIVYCLESTDLPEGVRVREIAVSPVTAFRPSRHVEMLGDVTTLEADLTRRQTGEWSSTLYRPWQRPEQSTVSTRLVPYFARANRGESEMSVWLPLASE